MKVLSSTRWPRRRLAAVGLVAAAVVFGLVSLAWAIGLGTWVGSTPVEAETYYAGDNIPYNFEIGPAEIRGRVVASATVDATFTAPAGGRLVVKGIRLIANEVLTFASGGVTSNLGGSPAYSIVEGSLAMLDYTANMADTVDDPAVDGGKKVVVKLSAVGGATAVSVGGLFSIGDDNDSFNPVIDPAISIKKYVSVDGGTTWHDANAAPGPYAYTGDPIKWKVHVTNPGNVDMEITALSDDFAPGGTFAPYIGDVLGPTASTNDSITVVYDDVAESGLLTNLAEVEAVDTLIGTDPQTDDDPANVSTIDPGITVLKEVSLDGGDTWHTGDDVATGYSPVDVMWRITVKNTGDVTLTVTGSDVYMPNFPGSPFELAPNDGAPGGPDEKVFNYTEPIPADGEIYYEYNPVTVEGAYVVGELRGTVDAESHAIKEVRPRPVIEVEKRVSLDDGQTWYSCPDRAMGTVPATATWEIRVINPSAVTTLYDVWVEDTNGMWLYPVGNVLMEDAGKTLKGTLDPGVTTDWFRYTEAPILAAGSKVNTATATGEDEWGTSVDDKASACYEVDEPPTGGATRTVGYWQTHLCYASHVLMTHVGDMLIQWKVATATEPEVKFTINAPEDLMGFLWASPASLDRPITNRFKRKPLAQAKAILARQMVAAILNTKMPSGLSGSFVPTTTGDFAHKTVDDLIAMSQKALALTSRSDRSYVIALSSILDYYNNYGDDEMIDDPDAIPGCINNAAPQDAKARANFRYPNKWYVGNEFLWMSYSHPIR